MIVLVLALLGQSCGAGGCGQQMWAPRQMIIPQQMWAPPIQAQPVVRARVEPTPQRFQMFAVPAPALPSKTMPETDIFRFY